MNCLPLYNPPPEDEEDGEDEVDSEQNSESERSASNSPERRRKSISLMKSRSAEALDTVAAELELHDRDFESYKSDEELYSRSVAAKPKKWSRMSTSFSKNLTVMVHNAKEELPQDRAEWKMPQDSEEELPQDRAEGKLPQDSEERLPQDRAEGEEMENKTSQTSLHTMETEEVGLKDVSEGAAVGENSNEGKPEFVSTDLTNEERGEEIKENGNEATTPTNVRAKRQESRSKKKKPVRNTKSSSPINCGVENGSDGEDEEQGLTVNYLDVSTMSTLKRSSGSVSFHHRTDFNRRAKSPSPNPMEASIEESCQELEDTDQPAIVVATRTLIAGDNSTPPSSCLTPSYIPTIPLVTHSLLPPPPPTLNQDYVERSGWLNKLSHRRGVFGDKWQKRYFVLHRSWLYYFKKYGVSIYIYSIESSR